jgi:hypothetical protein
MRVSKEKVPKKRVHPSASALILMAVAAAAAILSPMLLFLPVSAQEGQGTPRTDPGQPDDPDCWGEVSSTVAQREDDQPGLGEHASNPIPEPEPDPDPDEVDHDTPRDGVGNQAEDTPPEHGANVGQIVGGCQPDRNDQ